MEFYYLEVRNEPVAQGTQQLEQQVDVVGVMAEVVQQNLDDQLGLLPVLVGNAIHLDMQFLLTENTVRLPVTLRPAHTAVRLVLYLVLVITPNLLQGVHQLVLRCQPLVVQLDEERCHTNALVLHLGLVCYTETQVTHSFCLQTFFIISRLCVSFSLFNDKKMLTRRKESNIILPFHVFLLY